MDNSLKHRLKEARPSLYMVAPLTYSVCWGYAITNMLLGLGMYFLYKPELEIAVANILTYKMWGLLFGGLGVITTYLLLSNNWIGTRNAQLFGLGLKAVWAIALVVRCVAEPQTIVITSIWLFFAYIQAVTYIYFIPKVNGDSIK